MKKHILGITVIFLLFSGLLVAAEDKQENKVEIIKVYKQEVPAMRFIGKKYGDEDRVDGGFGKQFGEWHEKGWFAIIEKLMSEDLKAVYEDADAHMGLMRHKNGEPFQYWIGMFMPKDTDVPEGFEYYDFPKAELGICWVYGKEPDIYMKEGKCAQKLAEEGHKIVHDKQGATWFFERDVSSRFKPDEKGNNTLDIGFFLRYDYKVVVDDEF